LRSHLRVAFLFGRVCLLSTSVLAVRGDSIVDEAHSDKLRIKEAQTGTFDMGEVIPDEGHEAVGWQSLYSAYSCVYHHSYAQATRWLMDALRQGAGPLFLKGRSDLAYLSKRLSTIAAQRHEADVPESSCDAQVLQGLMDNLGGNGQDAIDLLKRVALNNPAYPSLPYLKTKIRAMEFQKSGGPYLIPPDVLQTGGNSNHFSRWNVSKLPLKVYVPPDAVATKVAGYHVGDGQLLRSAFETWQRQSAGKVRFVYEPVAEQADITCAWVSDQKDLHLADAIGVCGRWVDANNYLRHAEVKILTFTSDRYTPSGFDNQFRKSCLEEVCLHEIGHSFGLNHSSGENDVMCSCAHWQPLAAPTLRDMTALNLLYVTNAHDFIGAGFDALDARQYKAALVAFDKAISANPKDSQIRDAVCIRLFNTATIAIQNSDYAGAINLLTKANELASGSEPSQIKQGVLKSLHHAYLQSGKLKEAEALEKQDASLQTEGPDSASFLDQYGLKRESLRPYEEALAKHPDDLAIRKKFCILLVTLARDELNKDNDDEALSLLTRAKSLLRAGMPSQVITRVMNALKLEYSKLERYDEAEQTQREETALIPPPVVAKKDTSEDDIAYLVAAAKKIHPVDWSHPIDVPSGGAKLRLAYEEYVDALRQCAATANVKDAPAWAVAFIVRHKQFDGRSTEEPLGKMFDLRHRLIALTDESTVIGLEARVPFKKIEGKAKPSPSAK
jgi:tetratricopeptide (TPR) repeat protein